MNGITFDINRSNVLYTLMLSKGHLPAVNNENASFSYSIKPYGRIHNIPSYNTGVYCNKRSFYLLLRKNGLTEYIPPTYLNTLELPQKINGIWFVKKKTGSRGEEVYCFKNKSDIESFVSTLKPNSYIIQQGVKNLDLMDDCYKYTLRVYLLQLRDGRRYLFPRIVCIKHSKPFTENKDNHDIHVNHKNAERFDFHKVHPFANKIFENIKKACKYSFTCFADLLVRSESDYHIYGLDFLIDKDHKPWFIEMNGFPNLSSYQKDDREEILVDMFNDLYDFIIFPYISNNPQPKTTKFVRI